VGGLEKAIDNTGGLSLVLGLPREIFPVMSERVFKKSSTAWFSSFPQRRETCPRSMPEMAGSFQGFPEPVGLSPRAPCLKHAGTSIKRGAGGTGTGDFLARPWRRFRGRPRNDSEARQNGWMGTSSTGRRKSLTSSGGHKKACPPYSASRLVGWARFYRAHQNECRISARTY